jgi:hypothetical protein
MNRHITAAIVCAMSAFAVACSEGPTGIDPYFAVGDRTADNGFDSLEPGVVRVCAFMPLIEGGFVSFNATATGGEVIDTTFSVDNIIRPEPIGYSTCVEVWNATDDSGLETVTVNLLATSPGLVLESVFTRAAGVDEAGGAIDEVQRWTGAMAFVPASSEIGAWAFYKFYFEDPPTSGGQGCTPGYWKQSQHFGSWTGYTPGQMFSSVFAPSNAFSDKTLLQVLSLGGGGLNALGRHAVAALLNASSAGVDYDLSVQQVIDAFNTASTGSKNAIENQKNILDMLNNQGCGLGR